MWHTGSSSFVTYATVDYTSYTISLTEQGSASGYYVGTFPTAASAGIFNIVAKSQSAGTAAETDPVVGTDTFQWSGTVPFPLSDLATSGQIGQLAPLRVARGVMVQNFQIYLRSALDHVTPFVSGILSGQILRDNGASFGPLQSGLFTEKGQGFYTLQALTSGDLLGNSIALLFTANGCSGGTSDPLALSLITQRTSGQL